jgi:hypothetical protein
MQCRERKKYVIYICKTVSSHVTEYVVIRMDG